MKKALSLLLILALFVSVLGTLASFAEGDTTEDTTPEVSEQSTALSTPLNLKIDKENNTLTWDAVPGAIFYVVVIDGIENISYSASFPLPELESGKTHSIKVLAKANGSSNTDSEWAIFEHSKDNDSPPASIPTALRTMLAGMLGIFIVMGVIIGCVTLLNVSGKKKTGAKKE